MIVSETVLNPTHEKIETGKCLTENSSLLILQSSLISNIAGYAQVDDSAIFHRVIQSIKTFKDKEPAPFMDSFGALGKLRRKLRQREVILPDFVTIEAESCIQKLVMPVY